ncbi:hypothetical protein THAR02_03555 [Trichoderma harzianum]|uniref:SnoaL-like domain-containing protein n=1 Tax=Trichoderma harzianum TaxID=5544 RepID=A0A0F9ZWH7_TRIHA|nr:hypothetical protein THAR02_03555 [Trichoderma harzianum]
MSDLRSRMMELAISFLNAFNEFTTESVVRYRSENCKHRLLPKSLNAPPRTNSEFSAWIGSVQNVMSGAKLSFMDGYEPIIDDKSRHITLHLKSTGETALGEYQNEYVWIMKVDETGQEIVDIMEFADSAYTIEWFQKLQNATEKK